MSMPVPCKRQLRASTCCTCAIPTLPAPAPHFLQVLQHLEQLERIEAAAGARRAASGAAKPASEREQHRVSWVEFSTNQVGAGADALQVDGCYPSARRGRDDSGCVHLPAQQAKRRRAAAADWHNTPTAPRC